MSRNLVADIQQSIEQSADTLRRLREEATHIARAADMLIAAIAGGRKALFCGNGGSAADAQHLAAELMGRYLIDRNPLPALALSVDTSALTAIANDYGYEQVFARQLRGIGQPGDVLVGISTSGKSTNVVRAFEVARQMKIHTIALTGQSGGPLADLADVAIRVPSGKTNTIQEMHIVVGHMLCGYVENAVCSDKP